MRKPRASILSFAAAHLALPLAASAQDVPDYDFQWVTIGDPGNRDTNAEEAPWLFPPTQPTPYPIGGVDHVFRIATHEVSVEQWYDFVVAYAPYFDRDADNIGSSRFTSFWIRHRQSDDTFHITPGAERYPADMAWVYAARYANWLHNGKGAEQWAFEDGAYDTSTFGWDDDGNTRTDQREHHPDATFWIPTLDEATKARNWDPQKNSGEGGYWRYPLGTDDVPIVGLPEDGGQTNAGLETPDGDPAFLDVGSYPDVLTPWGLLDASGGETEWTEWAGIQGDRYTVGSNVWSGVPDFWDRVDLLASNFPHLSRNGLRIASIPSPGALVGLAVCLASFQRRRCT